MTERVAPGTLLSRRFRLVLLHLAEEARRDLDGIKTRPARAIHSLRTRMKNLRAILGLVKARVAKEQRKILIALTDAVKDAFAEQRDAQVVALLRAKLDGRAGAAPGSGRPLKARAGDKLVRADIARLIRLVSKLGLKGLTWGEVIERYVACYRDGRKALKACLRNRSAASFHKWRRAAKDLFYQSQVLQPLTGMKVRRMRADRLAERLGKLHDLHLLNALVGKPPGEGLRKKIARKKKVAKAAAIKTARKLYAARPGAIAVELERCAKFHPAVAAQSVRQT